MSLLTDREKSPATEDVKELIPASRQEVVLPRAVQEHFAGLLRVPSETCFYHERRLLVLALKDHGISTREIAKLLSVTPRRVRRIVVRYPTSNERKSME